MTKISDVFLQADHSKLNQVFFNIGHRLGEVRMAIIKDRDKVNGDIILSLSIREFHVVRQIVETHGWQYLTDEDINMLDIYTFIDKVDHIKIGNNASCRNLIARGLDMNSNAFMTAGKLDFDAWVKRVITGEFDFRSVRNIGKKSAQTITDALKKYVLENNG